MAEDGRVTDSSELLEAADRNMAAVWRGIAEAVAGPAAVVDRGHALLMSVGEPVPMFNPAFVRAGGGDPEAIVDEVTAHFEGLGMPFVLIFRDEIAPGLAGACARHGMVEHWQAPIMVLDPIPALVPPLPAGLAILPLGGAELTTYVRVLGEGFGMPPSMVTRIFGRWLLEMDGFTGFLGFVDGVPVATSGLYVSDGLAGVYNVATLDGYRGRGIGAAMTWAAAHAGWELGLSVSILQASRAGEPVYERMGYETPARYRQFEPG